MDTISFKAPAGAKKRLAQVAKARGLTPSRMAWLAVEAELHNSRRGALLGAGKHLIRGRSSYDPAVPAIPSEDWDLTR